MIYYFQEEAEKELLEAIEYYETCEPGLGIRFSEEVYSAIERICEYPFAWEQMDDCARRCLTLKFPYGILSRVSDETVIIIAVMNLHRMPSYWKART